MELRSEHNKIFTIPNALSVLRLGLIPLFLHLYCVEQSYLRAVGILALSGATDILDGWIARRFHMISDVGKILDPAADKLTQAALILSLCIRYRIIWLLLGLFLVKELTMGLLGLMVVVRTKQVPCAQWYGKVCTALLELSMGVLILFPNISLGAAQSIILTAGGALTGAMVLYVLFFTQLLRREPLPED